jgi:hypothetical protein
LHLRTKDRSKQCRPGLRLLKMGLLPLMDVAAKTVPRYPNPLALTTRLGHLINIPTRQSADASFKSQKAAVKGKLCIQVCVLLSS